MEKKDKAILVQNFSFITDNVDVEDIQGHLIQNEILIERDIEELNQINSKKTKCEKFLLMLYRKGPKAFKVFCDALQKNKKDYVITQLLGTDPPSENIDMEEVVRLGSLVKDLSLKNEVLEKKNQTLERSNENLERSITEIKEVLNLVMSENKEMKERIVAVEVQAGIKDTAGALPDNKYDQ